MSDAAAPSFESKLCAFEALTARVSALPRPVVMTNGVFDVVHRGHVTYLAQARALGASLVVAINSDASARGLGKGPDRPLNSAADRMAVIAALESVSLVTAFDEPTAAEAVRATHPDLYVKGGDYIVEETPEGRVARAAGARVQAIAFEHDRSTSALVNRIRGTA
jgi:rfaE bifunctional protein nucleotidyltransferase chain/domain